MTEIVSFICAILCGLGLGGGNLLVVYLTRIAGFDQQSAQGIGLIFFVSSTAVCLVIHAVKKRINKKLLTIALPPVIAGGIAGSFAALYIKGQLLSKFFGAFLILMGIITILDIRKK